MKKAKIIGTLFCLVAILVIIMGTWVYTKEKPRNTSEEMVSKVEDVLSDEYKKQSMTKIAATITYENESSGDKIYYYIIKTTYYEEAPSEITGLHTAAFGVLFPVKFMDSCEAMKIQEWPAALYKKGESAYLCWTCSPEVSYALEYNPMVVQDSEIIKMAESVKEVKDKKKGIE